MLARAWKTGAARHFATIVVLSLALGCSGGESGTQSGADAAANTDGNGLGEVTDDTQVGGDVADDTGGSVDTGGGTIDGSGDDADDTGGDDTVDGSGDTGDDSSDTVLDCPGGSGCECADNGDCDNGICIDTPDGKRCAEKCIDSCKKGYACKNVGDNDVVFVCVPEFLTLCSPCKQKSDCTYQGADSLCLDYGASGSFCGGPCKADDDCPDAGYACVDVLDEDVGKVVKQCKRKPDASGAPGQCTCSNWAKAAAKKTTCSVTNSFGTCAGTRQCTEAGLADCNSAVPAEESCNNVDDDCDGQTDVLPKTMTCGKSAWLALGSEATCTTDADCTVAGESCDPAAGLCHTLVGTCKGKPTCEGGEMVCKDAATPKVEACNGNDDDCDGAVDEDFAWEHPQTGAKVAVGGVCGVGPCAGGLVACETLLAAVCTTESKVKPDTCNGEDDDCDGEVDEAACDDGDACTKDVCDAKAQSCSNPPAVDCDDGNPCTADACDKSKGGCTHQPTTSSCDDGDACTVGDVCGTDGDGAAACLPGASTADCDDANPCTDDGCDAKTGCVQLPNAVTMACYTGPDGTLGKGTCSGGTRYCKDGKLGETCVGEVLPAQTEACDSLDDSCDGVTDEGCKAAGVDGSFATVSAKTADGNAQVVLGDGSVAGSTATDGNSGKSLQAGFVAWLRSLFE